MFIIVLFAVAGKNKVSAGEYTDAYNTKVDELHSIYASCPDDHFDDFFRWDANEGAGFVEEHSDRKFIFTQKWEAQAYFTHICPNYYFLQWFQKYYDTIGSDIKSECNSRRWAGTGYGAVCVRNDCQDHYDDCVLPIGRLIVDASLDFINKQSETAAPTTSTPSAAPSQSPASDECIDQSKVAHDALKAAGELELADFDLSTVGETTYYKYSVSSSYKLNCITDGDGRYEELDFKATCTNGTDTENIVVQGRPMCYGIDCEEEKDLTVLLDKYTLHPTEQLADKELGGVWECTLTDDETVDEGAGGDVCMMQSVALRESADIAAIEREITPEFKHKPLIWFFGERMEKEVWVESSYTSSLEIECANSGGTYVEVTNFKVHCKKGDKNKAEYDVTNYPMCVGAICDADVKNNETDTLLLLFTDEMSQIDEDLTSALVCELSGSVRTSVGLILAGIATSVWYLL